IVSRPDTRVPLKASTVESIIFNLIEIFQSLIGKVLLGFPTKKDLSFLLKGRTITIDNVAIESRISCVLSVPDYSSSLINCSGKSLLVSTDLPFERSESMYSLNQNIIGDVNETFFRIKNKDKFEKLHQTGLIDFNLGMSVSFLTLLLSLSAEYPFISSLIADAVLLNIWSFIWDPQDMTIIDNKIIEWLNSPDEVSTSNILSLLSTINIRKNV